MSDNNMTQLPIQDEMKEFLDSYTYPKFQELKESLLNNIDFNRFRIYDSKDKAIIYQLIFNGVPILVEFPTYTITIPNTGKSSFSVRYILFEINNNNRNYEKISEIETKNIDDMNKLLRENSFSEIDFEKTKTELLNNLRKKDNNNIK